MTFQHYHRLKFRLATGLFLLAGVLSILWAMPAPAALAWARPGPIHPLSAKQYNCTVDHADIVVAHTWQQTVTKTASIDCNGLVALGMTPVVGPVDVAVCDTSGASCQFGEITHAQVSSYLFGNPHNFIIKWKLHNASDPPYGTEFIMYY